jgi:hypothetical protein
MTSIVWAVLMVAAVVGAGVYINKANARKKKRKRA